MEANAALELPWPQLSEFIAQKTGLHFPPERRMDLQRGLASAAGEFGFADVAACADWLLSAPLTRPQLHALASHLTVGETYFFRERKTFDALAECVLPELIRRRSRERRLRLWSAACCTGEEPYSLAILLQQCIPDLQDWRISILATDINERFLQKAAAGVYGEWSFRESPAGFKESYFTRTPDGRFALLPRIKQRVTFAPLNLAEDSFPSLATDTHAMDLIFCRNVLMYFTPLQARKVVDHLRRALLDDGWLAVSSSEGSQTSFSGFAPMNFPGAILYRKRDPQKKDTDGPAAQPWAPVGEWAESVPAAFEPPLSWTEQEPAAAPMEPLLLQPVEEVTAREAQPELYAVATSLYNRGRYADAADTLLASFVPEAAPEPQAFSLLARSLANQGKVHEALAWCDRWIAADALDATGRYLRAVVLQELGNPEEARRSLQHALYLHPDFVLAHFALGNLARGGGRTGEANRHFANALALLRGCPPDDLLPESDGLTAGRLMEILTSLLALEAAA